MADYLQRIIFLLTTLMRVSCLHLGQNSGKLINTVSEHIFVRVLPWHTGHKIQYVSAFCFFILRGLYMLGSSASTWLWA